MPDSIAVDARVSALVSFYESLQPNTLALLNTLYAHDAHFKDPFNDVVGVVAINGIFCHMFASVDQPQFRVDTAFSQGDHAFLAWQFTFQWSGKPKSRVLVRGASHLVFNAQGKVCLHRDYWDAAEELYEKLPVLGSVMRWIKKRLRAS